MYNLGSFIKKLVGTKTVIFMSLSEMKGRLSHAHGSDPGEIEDFQDLIGLPSNRQRQKP